MPRIIFKCPHIKGGGRSAAHLSNYVKYAATREGVERIAKREDAARLGFDSADAKSGFLTTHGIEEIKSVLAKDIFEQDLITIYQRQTQRRDELTENAEEVMRQLTVEMQNGTLENQRIAELMTELARRLRHTSGKKQYGYLSPPLKSLVDEIVNELEKDPRIAAAYDLWYREREEVLHTYKDDLPERAPLSQQKEFKRIKNIIIGEAAKLGDVVQEVETVRTGDGGSGGGGDGDRDADDKQPRREPSPAPPSTVKATVPPGLVARSAASLLCQVGRIFEDKRPRPSAGPRVEVDSKLKRKIREKKIAMGHKPDDHEEKGQTMG